MVDYSFSLQSIEYFVLILIRVSMFIYIAPFFGMSNTPARVKVGLSAFIAIILYSVLPRQEIEYTGMFEYSIIVLKEGITGLLIGFAANVCNSIVLFAGNMIDTEIGLAMASEYDPVSRTQVTISGQIYNYLILLLLLVSNLQSYLIRAFVESYTLIPINQQVFNWEHLLDAMVTYAADLMIIAFQIILPIFACMMILNTVLGILAKVAPQMNMFAVGMQLKVLVGLAVMFLVIGLIPYVSDFIFTEMKQMVVLIVEGMY